MVSKSLGKTLAYLHTGRGRAQCRVTDRILAAVLWLHLPIALLLAWWFGKSSLSFAAAASVAIAGPASLLVWLQPGSLLSRMVIGLAIMTFSALGIHLSGGLIEYHFHIFVFLAVLASYRDVRLLVVVAAYVAAHHMAFNFVLPYSLFSYGPSFLMVILHAIFVVLEVAYLVADIQLKSSEFDFVDTTREVAEQVSLASRDMRSANQTLADNAGTQAASVQQITSTVAELEGQTQQTVQSVRDARGQMRTVGEESDSGMDRVQRMVQSMGTLREESASMGEMLKLIESIAFQTNLLALNAAVEAARAGDSGRGFAVVAEEVRNLAARSAKAAQDISGMVESALSLVREGYAAAEETHGVFEKINSGITGSEERLADVASGSEQLAQGMAQISAALAQIDGLTQQTSASASDGSEIAGVLEDQARELAAMLEGFTHHAQNRTENGAALQTDDRIVAAALPSTTGRTGLSV